MANVHWIECSCACCAKTREAVEAVIAERDEWKAEAQTQAELYRERCRERDDFAAARQEWQQRCEEATRQFVAQCNKTLNAIAHTKFVESERDKAQDLFSDAEVRIRALENERDEALGAFHKADMARDACRRESDKARAAENTAYRYLQTLKSELTAAIRERDEALAAWQTAIQFRLNVETAHAATARERDEARRKNGNLEASEIQAIRDRDEAQGLVNLILSPGPFHTMSTAERRQRWPWANWGPALEEEGR